jgi:hypothetical protein
MWSFCKFHPRLYNSSYFDYYKKFLLIFLFVFVGTLGTIGFELLGHIDLGPFHIYSLTREKEGANCC